MLHRAYSELMEEIEFYPFMLNYWTLEPIQNIIHIAMNWVGNTIGTRTITLGMHLLQKYIEKELVKPLFWPLLLEVIYCRRWTFAVELWIFALSNTISLLEPSSLLQKMSLPI